MKTKSLTAHFSVLILIAGLPLLTLNAQETNWAEALISGFQSLNSGPDERTPDLLFEAAEMMPRKNWEIYLLSATLYAPRGKQNAAFLSIERAIGAGFSDLDLLLSLSELNSLHNDPRWQEVVRSISINIEKNLELIQNPELLEKLKNMWELDQNAIAQFEKDIASLEPGETNEAHDRLFKSVENIWSTNACKLDSIIDEFGWPGFQLVGQEGEELSWSIAQHAPNVFFKQKCLDLIKQSVQNEDADPNHYAELHDRISRDKWQKQCFGASMGSSAPHPIKDPTNVDKRRIALGLFEPIEVYALYHEIEYKRPTPKEAEAEAEASYEEAQELYVKFCTSIKEGSHSVANSYILKAIEHFGDVSSEQLYQAAVYLAKANNKQSAKISLRILKVLVWRKWIDSDRLNNFEQPVSINEHEWQSLLEVFDKCGEQG